MIRGGLFGWISFAAFVAAFLPAARVCADEDAAYVITVTPGFKIPTPPHEEVDLSAYTADSVRQAIPAERGGVARIGPAAGERLLAEALRDARGERLARRQSGGEARAVFVERDAVTLGELAAQVNDAAVVDAKDGVVTIRLPVLIAPGATLIVDGKETPEVRLSTDRGAFIANGGTLIVVDALVTSWSELENEPTQFERESEFRPFIASFVRTNTLLATSKFEHLGYFAPTAYGVSLSSHPERNRGPVNDDWPTGVIVENEFRGLFYGFYSFEARDVAIVGNRYVDCVRYGIDPHDRSTRLVIARNTTSGTREKHGIIGSREVNHSWIVDNESYDNAGSGIMLDRESSHNVVRGNRVYRNGQGIAIYESSHNVIDDNLVAFNAKSGLRVRNSVDVLAFDNRLIGNDDVAFEISARRLDDHAKRFERGDKYEERVEVAIHGARVAGNRGLVKASQLDVLQLSGVQADAETAEVVRLYGDGERSIDDRKDFAVGGELKPYAREVLRARDADGALVEVRTTNSRRRGERWLFIPGGTP